LRVILTGLQRHGMFLADNGSNWYISGVPDERWGNDLLHQLGAVTGGKLGVADESRPLGGPNPGQVRSAPPSPAPTPQPPVAPRPADQVSLSRVAPGQMTVTVTAGVGSGAPNNRIRALRFGTPRNATILMGNQPVAGGSRVAIPNGATQTSLTIQRVQAG